MYIDRYVLFFTFINRLAAEQAARERARAEADAKEKEVQSRLSAAIAAKKCTFTVTNKEFAKQRYFKCGQCRDQACCAVCRDCCHAGHSNIRDCGVGDFYCTCGVTNCEGVTGVPAALKGKPTLKSIVDSVRSGEKWRDPDFPAGAASLFRDPRNPKNPGWKEFQFLRPEEMNGVKQPVLYSNGFEADDIAQGNIGE